MEKKQQHMKEINLNNHTQSMCVTFTGGRRRKKEREREENAC